MERQADLHVHTNLSDGTFTPREVVENAMETGLSCIAITDHDCVDGVEPARKAAGKKGPEIIAGVEMTAQEAGREVHILGYFPDLEDTRFRNRLEAIRKKRIDRVYRIVEKLKKYNITLRP
ncbi:MAG: PHP domain-containing protein, partial [Candidatus Omnitrophota bacterium]